ncbi:MULTISPECIES: hypothetical protein [Streptomyces]|uniref:hypothetical protein n=1 Tax=Streptomyces TaxID=1883 RepID=UPI00345C149F
MAFTQLLADAGLETAEAEGAGHVESLLRPLAAWRPVIAADATPTAAVRLDRSDLVAELNAQWYRLATGHGIIGADGTFLINVAGSRQDHVPRLDARPAHCAVGPGRSAGRPPRAAGVRHALG